MVAPQQLKAGWRLSVETFVRTTSMLTIYTLPMEAAAFPARLVHKVSKDHKAPLDKALALR